MDLERPFDFVAVCTRITSPNSAIFMVSLPQIEDLLLFQATYDVSHFCQSCFRFPIHPRQLRNYRNYRHYCNHYHSLSRNYSTTKIFYSPSALNQSLSLEPIRICENEVYRLQGKLILDQYRYATRLVAEAIEYARLPSLDFR